MADEKQDPKFQAYLDKLYGKAIAEDRAKKAKAVKTTKKITGVTGHGRRRYNSAMKKFIRDNPEAMQPGINEWLGENYPEGLVIKE